MRDGVHAGSSISHIVCGVCSLSKLLSNVRSTLHEQSHQNSSAPLSSKAKRRSAYYSDENYSTDPRFWPFTMQHIMATQNHTHTFVKSFVGSSSFLRNVTTKQQGNAPGLQHTPEDRFITLITRPHPTTSHLLIPAPRTTRAGAFDWINTMQSRTFGSLSPRYTK